MVSVGVILYAILLIVGTLILGWLWWRHFGHELVRVMGEMLRAFADAFKP